MAIDQVRVLTVHKVYMSQSEECESSILSPAPVFASQTNHREQFYDREENSDHFDREETSDREDDREMIQHREDIFSIDDPVAHHPADLPDFFDNVEHKTIRREPVAPGPRMKHELVGREENLAFAMPTLFPNSIRTSFQPTRKFQLILPETEMIWNHSRSASCSTSWTNYSRPNTPSIKIESTRLCSRRAFANEPEVQVARPRSIRSFNARLNGYAQKGNYQEILALIDSINRGELEIASPLNTYSYTILVKAYCNSGKIHAAERLLKDMESFPKNQGPNRFTYNILLNACVKAEDMRRASQLFTVMEFSDDENLKPDHVTFTTLMKGYAAAGDMEAAQMLLSRLLNHPDPLYRPNHVTYNTMLKGFASNGDMKSAEKLLAHMYDESSCRPDLVSMNTIIGGYCRNSDMDSAGRLFEMMKENQDDNSIEPNAVTYQAMIEGYARTDNMEKAEILFNELEQKFGEESVISSSTMQALIAGSMRTKGVDFHEDIKLNMN